MSIDYINYTTKPFLHSPPQLAKNPFTFAEIALYPLVHWWLSGRLFFTVGQPLDDRECFGSQIQSSVCIETPNGPRTQTFPFLRKKGYLTLLIIIPNLSYTSTIPFPYALIISQLCQASAESNNHRSLQHPVPDLLRERKQTVLSPWSPSA